MRLLRRNRKEAEPAEVEAAMARVAAEDSDETRSALYTALLNTTLFAATPEAPPEDRSWRATGDEKIDLLMLDSDEGQVLPVFTSVERLGEYAPGGGYVALPSRALFEMALAAGIYRLALNLESETVGTIVRSELEAMARGRLPLGGGAEALAKRSMVLVGDPAQRPADEVLAAVRSAVEAEPSAVAAWLHLMQEGSNAPELVIAVELAEGVTEAAEAAAMRAIVQAAGDQSAGAREFVFTVIDDRRREPFGGAAGELLFARQADRGGSAGTSAAASRDPDGP